jgi:uncharacterized membrane protein YphA (DoxX/SURF4 family)
MASPNRMQSLALWTARVVLALAFGAAGAAKLAALPPMVDLFDHIGVGQWFRVLTGAVELAGALMLFFRASVFYASALLSATMFVGTGVHLFVIGGNPVPALVLCLLSAFVAWRTRPEGVASPHPSFSHR